MPNMTHTPYGRALIALLQHKQLTPRSMWLKSAASNQSFTAWERQVLQPLCEREQVQLEVVGTDNGQRYGLSAAGKRNAAKLLGLTEGEAERGLAIAPSCNTNRMQGKYVPAPDCDTIVRPGARDHEAVGSI